MQIIKNLGGIGMKKRFLGALTALMMFSCPISFAHAEIKKESLSLVKFSDILEHWSKKSVDELLRKNAIPFGEDEFMPENAVKRSEFAFMLHNAMDIKIYYYIEPNIKDYFDDINNDDSYASNVIDLVSADIFQCGGSFNPYGTMTREEMIHYIMQAYKYKMGDEYSMIKIEPSTFSDTNEITAEYSVDIALAQHYGLILGMGDNKFEPKKIATRAEAAVIIDKLIKLPEGQNLQVDVEPKAIVNDDSIEMRISVKNNSKNDVSIVNSSGQVFDFQLLDEDKNVLYTWSADKLFTLAFNTTNIEAGSMFEFGGTLSGDEYIAIKDKIFYMKAYLTGNANFINKEGYEIKLK